MKPKHIKLTLDSVTDEMVEDYEKVGDKVADFANNCTSLHDDNLMDACVDLRVHLMKKLGYEEDDVWVIQEYING